MVRAPVVIALGQRGARGHADKVRKRFDDRDEAIEVRVAAVTALAAMCDTDSVDVLTRHAKKLADPTLIGDARLLSSAALAALGSLRPPDLAKRLEPLLAPGVPTPVQQAARAAQKLPSRCKAR
jgi:HEAT repeat protein